MMLHVLKVVDSTHVREEGIGYLDEEKACYFCKDLIPAGCYLYYTYIRLEVEQKTIAAACRHCSQDWPHFAYNIQEYRCASTSPCYAWHLTREVAHGE